MKIIYVSSLVSKKKMNSIIEKSKNKPLQSIQKFHRLICEGLVKNNVEVETISAIPISRKISSKTIWIERKEYENGVQYNYLPFINIKILRQLFIFLSTIVYVIKYIATEGKNIVFVCDILNTTISFTTITLSKIFKVKCLAIVTDLPKDMEKNKKINEKMQIKYDGYILLTEKMNEVVNPQDKPNVVIEGLADIEEVSNSCDIDKYKEKVCIYAGGLYEKYGVKFLIQAFSEIEDEDARLHIYGTGELEKYIMNCQDKRILYLGVVTNDIIIEEEKKATLLINPRFTNEEYTKYSFPSKNIEYMVSGTPVLTTKLPGMPKEYYEYVYFIEKETIDGIKRSIELILEKPKEELNEKGCKARKFILERKNNKIQTEKMIDLLMRIK